MQRKGGGILGNQNTADTAKKQKSALPLLRERVILTAGCGIIIAALLLAFGIIFQNIRHVVRQTAQLLDIQATVIGEQTADLLDDYARMCEVLAVNRSVLDYAGYDGSENSNLLTQAGYNLSKDLNSMCSVYGRDINTLAIYFTRSQSVITMARQLTRENNALFFNSYPALSPQSLTQIPPGVYWSLHYGDETDSHHWIVRKVRVQSVTVAYIIVEYNLDGFIRRHTSENSLVLIGSADGLLYACDPAFYAAGPDFAGLCEQAQDGSFTVLDNEYTACLQDLRLPELKVLAGVPAARLRQITALFTLVTVVTGLVVLLAFGVLILHLQRRLLSPLEHLMRITRPQSNDTPQALHLIADDYVAARTANEQMQAERDAMIPLALGRQFNHLVEAVSDEQALLYAQSCLLLANIPQEDGYVVFAVRCAEDRRGFFGDMRSEPRANKRQDVFQFLLNNVLNDLLYQEFPGIAAPFRSDWYLVVTACGSAADAEQVGDVIHTLQDTYDQAFGAALLCTPVSWGVSPAAFVHSVMQVSQQISYLDFWGGAEESGAEEGAGDDADTLPRFRSLIYKLFARLNAEDYERIPALVDSMLESTLPTGQADVQTTRYRIYAMAALLTATIDEQMGSDPEPPPVHSYEQRLYRAENLTAFKHELQAVIAELIAYKEAQETPTVTSGRIEEIKKYILQHYTENELTAASVASAFGLSSSYLSRAFKEYTGVNILEYIQRLRVDAAKQLLKTETVKAVAQKVGFWDTRGLVRAFKKYENLTPGEYKRLLEQGKTWE